MDCIVDNSINIKFKCDTLLLCRRMFFFQGECHNETKSSGSACKNKCIGKEKDVKQVGFIA